jgi:hypothetical protein
MLNYDSNGEGPEALCCDVCEKQASGLLREEASVMRFFYNNKRCYTAQEAAGVLARIREIHWSEDEAQIVIDHLINTGRLMPANDFLWKGALTVKGNTPL